MRKTLVGMTVALWTVVLGASAPAQKSDNDRDAGKGETVRGVIAGVTLAGEMVIDETTRRVQASDMMFLTVVGSPVGDAASSSGTKDRGEARGAGRNRARHNVYVVKLGPKTEVRDATAHPGDKNEGKTYESPGPRDNPVAVETLEVGDQVRVTFTRRDPSGAAGGGNPPPDRRHGRHRIYFGNATSVVILSEPSPVSDSNNRAPARERDRDDDKDKVKGRSTKDDNK